MITKTHAKSLYDAGALAKANGEILRRAICELNGSWSENKAFEMGYNGVEWKIQEWTRYGKVPDGPSYNYMDQRPEKGVSVVTDEWKKTIHGIFYTAKYGGRKMTTFSGVFTGYYGGDDEPLVLPVE